MKRKWGKYQERYYKAIRLKNRDLQPGDGVICSLPLLMSDLPAPMSELKVFPIHDNTNRVLLYIKKRFKKHRKE